MLYILVEIVAKPPFFLGFVAYTPLGVVAKNPFRRSKLILLRDPVNTPSGTYSFGRHCQSYIGGPSQYSFGSQPVLLREPLPKPLWGSSPSQYTSGRQPILLREPTPLGAIAKAPLGVQANTPLGASQYYFGSLLLWEILLMPLWGSEPILLAGGFASFGYLPKFSEMLTC